MIVEAADNQQQRRPHNEMWWQHIIGLHGDENTLFQSVGIERAVFLGGLALVRNVRWDARGRRGVIRSTRESLFGRTGPTTKGDSGSALCPNCLIDCLRMVSNCLGEILCFLKKISHLSFKHELSGKEKDLLVI